MADWGAGYHVETGYTYGFFKETAPAWLDCLAALKGVEAPTGSRRVLELGCGYGYGLILLAGLYPDHEFVGVDFNPTHIAHGCKLAAEAGVTNVRFEEADFVDLAADWPCDWGEFDYIVAHGIISWVAPEIRQALMRVVDLASTPGALVYLSYNAMPGKTTMAPIQHLLRLWQRSEGREPSDAISTGIARLVELREVKTGLNQSLPLFSKTAEQLRGKDSTYLVHEFLNDAWYPFWFDQMAREAKARKLNYVGTANLADIYVDKVLSKEQLKMLAQYDDPIVREVMLDVVVNRGFRKDVFVRGRNSLSSLAQREVLLETMFVGMVEPDSAEFKFTLAQREVSGKDEVYRPLLEALSTEPKSLRDLLGSGPEQEKAFQSTLQAVVFMLNAGLVDLARPLANKKPAKALNRVAVQRISAGAPYNYLIASEIGCAVRVQLPEAILAHAVQQKVDDAKGLAAFLVDRLTQLGKALVRDDEALNNLDAMTQHAETLAEAFLTTTLPKWKKIGIL